MVKKLKIGAIIQARLGSTRLPDKVLFSLPFGNGKTILEHIISRAEAANVFNEIIVATTSEKTDDPIAALLEAKNLPFFRGSEVNVLERYFLAAQKHELDIVVRLTADNPCIDPESLKEAVHFHLTSKNDYTKTTGLPLGMNLEVFSFSALQKAHAAATSTAEQEHVTAYFYTHPDLFKLGTLPFHFQEKAFSDFRLTVDYPADFALVNLLFGHFRERPFFGIQELYDFWLQNRWLSEVNGANFQKRIFENREEEIAEAEKILQFYGLSKAAGILTGNP